MLAAKFLAFGILLYGEINAFTLAHSIDDSTPTPDPNIPSADVPETKEPNNCEIVKAVKGVGVDGENVERTVKCTCTTGLIAGTTREKPACVAETIFKERTWCDMNPCLEHESCEVMEDKRGWLCKTETQTKKVVVENNSTLDENKVQDIN